MQEKYMFAATFRQVSIPCYLMCHPSVSCISYQKNIVNNQLNLSFFKDMVV